MIDAAGAIYVLGGEDCGATDYNDVWVSTNGGARPDSVGGVGWSGMRLSAQTRTAALARSQLHAHMQRAHAHANATTHAARERSGLRSCVRERTHVLVLACA